MSKKHSMPSGKKSDYLHELMMSEYKDRKLSLSAQFKMASLAILISQLIEILGDIIHDPTTIDNLPKETLIQGIEFINQLDLGSRNIDQNHSTIGDKSEYMETLDFISDQSHIDIAEGSQVAKVLFHKLAEGNSIQDLEGNEIEMAQEFLRATRRGFLSQLDATGRSS